MKRVLLSLRMALESVTLVVLFNAIIAFIRIMIGGAGHYVIAMCGIATSGAIITLAILDAL